MEKETMFLQSRKSTKSTSKFSIFKNRKKTAVVLFLLVFILFSVFGLGGISLSSKYSRFGGPCVHPEIDYFDEDIMQYYGGWKKKQCEFKNISFLKDRMLVVNIPEYECKGRCHTFKTAYLNFEGLWHNTTENYAFPCDVVETHCKLKTSSYNATSTYFLNTQVVEMPYYEYSNPKISVPAKQYSVYFIVIDSQAHTQVYRNLNKSNKYLTEEMGAVIFPYMNRIHDASRENGLAWFYGKLSETIHRPLYNLPPFEVEHSWANNCDRDLRNETTIIQEFSNHGYLTSSIEDWWRTIEYDCKGTDTPLAHHTYTPYVVAYEKYERISDYTAKKQCLHRHKHALDYLSQFVNSYNGEPKMAFMWLSHVGHNTEGGSRDLDPDLLKFLIQNTTELDDSFIFIGGDHGLRFGGATKTKVGRLDENNPAMIMTVPKELRQNKEMLETLRENAKELQTHFDTRATLLDILKFQPKTNFFTHRSLMNIPGELGHPFLRKQPKPKNCQTLPIPFSYCICEPPMKIDIARNLSNFNRTKTHGKQVINLINQRIEDHHLTSKCRFWTFHETTRLTQLSQSPLHFDAVVKARESEIFMGAEFHVYFGGNNETTMELLSVGRIDAYGKRGDCVAKRFQPICDCFRSENVKSVPKIKKTNIKEQSGSSRNVLFLIIVLVFVLLN